jgi:hypothetical protein
MYCDGSTGSIRGPGLETIDLREIVPHHMGEKNSWGVYYCVQTDQYYVSSLLSSVIDVLDSNFKPVRQITGCDHTRHVVTDGQTLVAWSGNYLSILSDGVWTCVPDIQQATGAGFSSDGRIFISNYYDSSAIHVHHPDGHWIKIDLSFRPGDMTLINNQLTILDNDPNRIGKHRRCVVDLDTNIHKSFQIPNTSGMAVKFQN